MLALDPRVVDAVFTAIAAHLPPRPPDTHPLGCHRPRISDRDCFTGILIRLVTGCSWDVAARLSPAGETTLRDRRTEWLTAGVFDHLLKEALAAYDRIIGLDLSEVAVDGSLHKAPCGGEGTGPNPTDRAKTGWKWSVATDRLGIPVGWTIDGANRHDSILLKPTLQTVADRGLLTDIETLHLDRGYDSAVTTTRCTELGLTDVVCAKKRVKGALKAKKPLNPRDALARGTHQLLVLQLRPATPQHRPIHPPTPRPDRPRRHPHPDRQTRQMGEKMEQLTTPIRARSNTPSVPGVSDWSPPDTWDMVGSHGRSPLRGLRVGGC